MATSNVEQVERLIVRTGYTLRDYLAEQEGKPVARKKPTRKGPRTKTHFTRWRGAVCDRLRAWVLDRLMELGADYASKLLDLGKLLHNRRNREALAVVEWILDRREWLGEEHTQELLIATLWQFSHRSVRSRGACWRVVRYAVRVWLR